MINWYCLYTKAKQEEIVTFKLSKHDGIQIFNPKLKLKKFVRGKLKEVIEELFPCYIFSRFDPSQHYHMIKYTRGVKRIVGNKEGYPFIIDEGLLEGLVELTDAIADQAHDQHGIDCLLDDGDDAR